MRNFGSKAHFIYRCTVLPQNLGQKLRATGPRICLNGIISDLSPTKIDRRVDCNRFQDHGYFALGARSKKVENSTSFCQNRAEKMGPGIRKRFYRILCQKRQFSKNILHEKVFQEKCYKWSKNVFFNLFTSKIVINPRVFILYFIFRHN